MHPARRVLDEAETVAGSCFVFHNGNLHNYYHWMVEAMVALHLLVTLCGPPAKLVLPAVILEERGVDDLAILRELGFDQLEMVQRTDDRPIRVEEAIWLEGSDDIAAL